ncbi:ribonuclease H-like domain-containing protein [Tanacetum coccineum]
MTALFLQYTQLVIPKFLDTLIQQWELLRSRLMKEKRLKKSRVVGCMKGPNADKQRIRLIRCKSNLDASLVDKKAWDALKEQDTSSRSGNDAHADDADIRPIYDEEPMAEERESAVAKPRHMIAPGSSRYSSNDMVHNHYLEEAKKKMLGIKHFRTIEELTTAGYRVTTAGSRLLLLVRKLMLLKVFLLFQLKIDQGVGSTSGIRACALRNFDLEDIIKKKSFTHKEEMAPMASSDPEVKTCSKTCLKNYEALKKQYDDLLVKLSDTGFKAATYKRGLATLEGQIVKYREHEVLFSEEIALLKRSVGSKEYQMGLLRDELEKVKQEKEGFEFKIAKFDKSAKDLEQLLGCQITDKSKKGSQLVDNNKKGLGYNAVSPPPTGLFAPPIIDLSHSGIEKFKEPEFEGYGVKVDKCVSETSPKEIKKTPDALIIEDWVSDDEEQDESKPKSEKKTVIPTVKKKEFVKAKQDDKTVRNTVKYAEMYRSQKPRGNQRNWNNLKSQQLGNEFVMNNKACFACGSFNHLIKDCKRKVQKPIWNNARRVNHHNSHRMSYPHPKRNFVPKAVLMKTGMRPVNAAKPKAAYNAVKRNRFNAVKASACWVWMPKNRVVDHVSKNISASVTLKRLDYIDAQGRFKSVMAWMDAQAQGRQECSKEKEESREECSKSRKTKKMKCLEESSQQRK